MSNQATYPRVRRVARSRAERLARIELRDAARDAARYGATLRVAR
jgi:hypothetical protein